MHKLLLCLLCALLVGIATLQMRQQQLELKHQAAELQLKIERQQSKLWNQQLAIAEITSPEAMARNQAAAADLDLVPVTNLPAAAAEWLVRSESQGR